MFAADPDRTGAFIKLKKMKLYIRPILMTLLIFVATACSAQTGKGEQTHQIFNGLLQKYVSATGAVNYAGLKKDQKALDTYLNELAEATPTASWSKNAALAYWLNAYNAFTLKLIVDNYPLKSIKDLDKGKPWDVKRITLGNKKYSLNNIENDIIRPGYKDPRIHFAVNCAAVSCPPLYNKAFTAGNVNALLEMRTRSFINSSANDLSASKIKISRVFDWYGEDFENVTAFVKKYSKTPVNANASVSFKEYNWSLNSK